MAENTAKSHEEETPDAEEEDGEAPTVRERDFRGMVNNARRVRIWTPALPDDLGWVEISKVVAKELADKMKENDIEEICAYVEKGVLYIDEWPFEEVEDPEGEGEGEEEEEEEDPE